jgi:hypothetical protein
VRSRAVDPRDTRWEVDNPAYRVYFFEPERGDPPGSWQSDEYEITEADVAEVLTWAKADGRVFVLYVLAAGGDGPGLIRLVGADPNDADNPSCLG